MTDQQVIKKAELLYPEIEWVWVAFSDHPYYLVVGHHKESGMLFDVLLDNIGGDLLMRVKIKNYSEV